MDDKSTDRTESDGVSRRSFVAGTGSVSLLGQLDLETAPTDQPTRVYTGPRDARPAPGRGINLYFAPDTGELFCDDGSEWGLVDITAADGRFISLLANDATFRSLAADSAVINGAARAASTQLNPKSQDLKSTPSFPTEWTKLEEPVIVTDQTVGNQAAYPSVLHAGKFLDDPLDEWYLYWAGHDGGGIRLHTAPALTGPWTPYRWNPVFDAADMGGGDHVSSPCAVWNPDGEVLHMYYHRAHSEPEAFVQDTEVATSTDGLSFDSVDTALYSQLDGSWDEQERSYFEVFRDGGNWFGVYQGRDRANNNTGLGWAWSSDGIDWETLRSPLFSEAYDGDEYVFPSSPSITEFGGDIWVLVGLYEADAVNQSIRAMRIDSVEQRGVSNVKTVFEPTLSWEGAGVTTPRAYYHDDRLYMFYAGKEENPLGLRIGLAYTELGGYP